MAKTESTAVTEFINSVRRQPIDGYNGTAKQMTIRNQAAPALPTPNRQAAGTPAPEWSEPPPATRARGTMPPSSRATQTMAPPPLPMRTTGSRPAVRAPSQLIVPPHLQATPEELELIDDTAEQPRVEAHEVASPNLTHPMERTWFEAPQEQIDALDIPDFGNDEDDLDVSIDFEKPARRKLGLMALGGLVVAGGVATAAYIAFSGAGMQKTAPATASQAVAPADTQVIPAATPVAPAAAPVAAAPVVPAVVDTEEAVPTPADPGGVVLHRASFTSEPVGATVTLVMNGRPVVLGAAPVDAQLDPTKSYEVVFTMPGRETVLRSVVFDESGTIAMNAELGDGTAAAPAVAVAEPSAEPVAEAAPEPEPEPVARKTTRKTTKAKKTRSARRATRSSSSSSRSKKAVATSIPRGAGVLMLNAKPPCDIIIDGSPTGKKTPQRALTLPAGKHRIGLVNKTYGIKASFTVSIKAGEKKRIVKDMTDRM